jgi:hypothetical protein
VVAKATAITLHPALAMSGRFVPHSLHGIVLITHDDCHSPWRLDVSIFTNYACCLILSTNRVLSLAPRTSHNTD